MNKNTEQFKWDDKLAMELCEYVGMRVGKDKDIRQQVELLTEDFKQSKSKTEQPAPKEEQVPIKAKEIEDGINTFESFSKGYSMGYHDAKKYTDKKYTEEQLLQARRDAFDAARVRIATYDGEQYFPTTKVKYKDNEDYINSLNK